MKKIGFNIGFIYVFFRYNAILKDVFGSQEVLDKIAAYTDFFNFLSNKTGTNVTNLSNVKAIYQLLTAQVCKTNVYYYICIYIKRKEYSAYQFIGSSLF